MRPMFATGQCLSSFHWWSDISETLNLGAAHPTGRFLVILDKGHSIVLSMALVLEQKVRTKTPMCQE